jgi:hypothetical protein
VSDAGRGPKGDKGDSGEGMNRGTRYAMVFLFFLAMAIGVAALVRANLEADTASTQARAANARAHAQCKFDADIGGVPVTVSTTGKPSKLGVTIVSDARVAWHLAGCSSPMLGAPAPSFVKWAPFYKLPVN